MAHRVGIVGVGWGAIVHAPAFGLVDDYEVVAICGRNPDRLAAGAERAGIADTSTDWEAFVQRDDLDVISISTPVPAHHPMTLAALEAGKHVLCEKPLALSPAQGEDMVAAAERAGTATATCFELRWTPERSKVRQLVGEGLVGDPYYVRLTQSLGVWHPTHKNQALWMYDIDEGGGYLMGLVAHDIDFVSSLFGRPVQVCADVRTAVPTRPLPDGSTLHVTADDTSALILRLDSGAMAVLTASAVGVHAYGAVFDVFGTDGTISGPLGSRAGASTIRAGRASDDGLQDVAVDDRMPRSGRPLPARSAAGPIRAMALMLEDWLPALEGRETAVPIPSLADGLLVQRVIAAARESADGAGWVDVG